jgi:hypothetical protein
VLALCAAATGPGEAYAACAALPGDAFAFLPANPPTDHCRPDPIVRWPAARVVFDCGFFADGQHGVSCGQDAMGCVDLCRTAAATWNTDLAGRFQFVPADASTPVGFCTSGGAVTDGRTSIGGSATICDGSAFGPNVIAVTLRQTRVDSAHLGELIDSDITVNNARQFTPDLFRGVVGHELGHVLGLDHPDQCGHDAVVLMRSAFQLPSTDPCFVSEPTADDIRGAVMIYASSPVPTSTPGFVCGDADGNGTVSVTDGVQALRMAAGLTSTCTLARCDVDGNGEVTVSDGVNVLRRAAGLSGADACVAN